MMTERHDDDRETWWWQRRHDDDREDMMMTEKIIKSLSYLKNLTKYFLQNKCTCQTNSYSCSTKLFSTKLFSTESYDIESYKTIT